MPPKKASSSRDWAKFAAVVAVVPAAIGLFTFAGQYVARQAGLDTVRNDLTVDDHRRDRLFLTSADKPIIVRVHAHYMDGKDLPPEDNCVTPTLAPSGALVLRFVQETGACAYAIGPGPGAALSTGVVVVDVPHPGSHGRLIVHLHDGSPLISLSPALASGAMALASLQGVAGRPGCAWEPSRWFHPADNCGTSFRAPSEDEMGAFPDRRVPIKLTVTWNAGSFEWTSPPYVVAVGSEEARVPAITPAPVLGKTSTPVREPIPEIAPAAREIDVAGLLAKVSPLQGQQRYEALWAELGSLPPGVRLKGYDAAALMGSSGDAGDRADAVKRLLPRVQTPLPAAQALALLGGLRGLDRLSILQALAPCVARPISPAEEGDLLGGIGGSLRPIGTDALEGAASCTDGFPRAY